MRCLWPIALVAACHSNPAHKDAAAQDTATPDAAACQPVAGTAITVRHIAATQSGAVLVTSPPGDKRNFVVEVEGRIKLLVDDVLEPTPFLDISSAAGGPVSVGNTEMGLLGLAFHPQFATNGTFFVFYTTRSPIKDVLARYQVSATDPNRADPASGVVVLSIDDPADTHNGGMIEFGADGFLYIGTGDGGRANDPQMFGQNPNVLLGKMLRIDVDHQDPGKQYAIPPGNPGGGAPEIFMIGLRNPWRWSFDAQTQDLWIGDVGQDQVEELDVIRAGMGAGANLGWSMYEGTSCFRAPCDPAGKTMPQFEIRHSQGWCSITAGQVYRGACYPDLAGKHLFTDWCKHTLVSATLASDGSVTTVDVPTTMIDENGTSSAGFPASPASIHAAARGDLYLTTHTGVSSLGAVWRIEAGP